MREVPDDQDPLTPLEDPDAIDRHEDDPERMVFPGPAEHPPTDRARPDVGLVEREDEDVDEAGSRSRAE